MILYKAFDGTFVDLENIVSVGPIKYVPTGAGHENFFDREFWTVKISMTARLASCPITLSKIIPSKFIELNTYVVSNIDYANEPTITTEGELYCEDVHMDIREHWQGQKTNVL